MRKIPLFSPMAEGMMAALASRAYDWRYWEIEESFEVTDQGVSNLVTLLRATTAKGEDREFRADRSSFAAVDGLFQGLGQNTQLKAAQSDWQTAGPSLADFFPENGSAPELKTLLAQRSSLSLQRIKNSLGFAKDSII